MAIENVQSTLIANSQISPPNTPVLNTSGLSRGIVYVSSATCAVNATASQYSTYRFFSIPSNAIVHELWLTTSANFTSVTAATLGIANRIGDLSSYPDVPGGATKDANTGLYMPYTTTLSAWGTKTLATALAATNMVAANLTTLADQQKRVWDLAGDTKDWLKHVDFVMTFNATNSGSAGSIGIKAYWSI
jgi:hypothetical protein